MHLLKYCALPCNVGRIREAVNGSANQASLRDALMQYGVPVSIPVTPFLIRIPVNASREVEDMGKAQMFEYLLPAGETQMKF